MKNIQLSPSIIFASREFWEERRKEPYKKASMSKVWIIFISTVMFLVLVGCDAQPATATQKECPDVIPTPALMPEFLRGVYPTGIITKAKYDEIIVNVADPELETSGGIRFTISMRGAYGNRSSSASNKTSLKIDGQIITDEEVWVGDGMEPSGPLYYNWPVDIGNGSHEATLNFDLYSGETVTYSWSFCIAP